MNIVVVSGSSRPKNQSRKLAGWAQAKLQGLGVVATVVDLNQTVLPLDENLNVKQIADAPRSAAAWQPIRTALQQADGFVVVTPEWSGMAPPALMNFFVYAAADETLPLAHKPIQLCAVSSGKGGDYPTAELRAFVPKNSHALFLPGHVVVRDCEKVFNTAEPEAGNDTDEYLQKRLGYELKVLLGYAKALSAMRSETQLDPRTYPSGM